MSPEDKSLPLDDADLHGAAVLQISLMDAQSLVDELERLRMVYAKQIGALSLILKGFSDLFTELTDEAERRKWLSKQIARAEREAARLRLPAWIWRIDSEGDLLTQLRHRAGFLHTEVKAHKDDIWDILLEVLNLNDLPVNEATLLAAITGGGHANS